MAAPADTLVTILLATGNKDKVRELKPMLEGISPRYRVLTLAEAGIALDVEETEPTLEGNAMLKAEAIFEHARHTAPYLITLADDTGLEVDALQGEPGVYSARFAPVAAGSTPTYAENVAHLLARMEGMSDRRARFRTVIALKGIVPAPEGSRQFTHTAEGIVQGSITLEPQGEGGFGYDPLFLVEGEKRTFAAMDAEEKNALSHRGRALRAAVRFLGRLAEKMDENGEGR